MRHLGGSPVGDIAFTINALGNLFSNCLFRFLFQVGIGNRSAGMARRVNGPMSTIAVFTHDFRAVN